MRKETMRIGSRTKGRKRASGKGRKDRMKKKEKRLVVGQITGNLIPWGYKESYKEIGKPGQSIYEKKVILKKDDGISEKLSTNILKEPSKSVKTKLIKKPLMKSKGGKPKILFLTDVIGWAWWIKSHYIKKYISDEFDIDIKNYIGSRKRIDENKYDLYFTFGYSFITKLKGNIPRNRKITGVTAHRPLNIIIPRMRKAGFVHANSLLLYNELKNYGFGNRLYYLPNGVDTKLFRPITTIPRKRKNIIIGHIGKLSPQKGQNEFIKPAIKKAGVESFFHLNKYTSRIKHEEMYKKYQGFDIFIVASKEDGTPNPALEAAACGRPIISNKIGNMPEFIEDGYNGFLVEKDVDAYVEKINWFKNNKDKITEMGKNARKTAEEWTWKIQAENYRKMFKDILNIEG